VSSPPHVYLSTACMHELHDKCIKKCKFCPSKCVCDCHVWNRDQGEEEKRDG